jgi:IS4 transposase
LRGNLTGRLATSVLIVLISYASGQTRRRPLTRSAVEIAARYKMRWQIELLFRWIKQHLKIRKFLGRSENAVRLQLIAAMIAYLLLRLAARDSRNNMPAIRFAELVARCLFVRKPIARLDKPPEVNPPKPRSRSSPDQLELC